MISYMKTARPRLLLITLSLSLSAGLARADDFVFIRSAKQGTAKLGKAEARAAFTGKAKNWPGGDVVQVILTAEGSPEMKWLAEKVIGISESALRNKMKQEAFKGEMRTPISVDSVAACLAQLKTNSGGICAADAASATNLPAGLVSTPLAD